jgi:DNA-binding MarR family transcriptional regulator
VPSELRPEVCNCLALRQAARVVTQFYDQHLAASGLRTTQYSILAKLDRLGAMTINSLAAELVMDRTTLGRNILPLERDGLIRVRHNAADARSRDLELTPKGAKRVRTARPGWLEAQEHFNAAFGGKKAAGLRALLKAVVASELGATPLTVVEKSGSHRRSTTLRDNSRREGSPQRDALTERNRM